MAVWIERRASSVKELRLPWHPLSHLQMKSQEWEVPLQLRSLLVQCGGQLIH